MNINFGVVFVEVFIMKVSLMAGVMVFELLWREGDVVTFTVA